MTSLDLMLDIALRLASAFYLFASIAGFRRLAMDSMLDQAIAAIGGAQDKREALAQERRSKAQFILLLAGGLAAILTLLMISWGAFALVGVTILNLLFLGLIAPKFLDPFDPPAPESRRMSWIANVVYALFALLAVLHWRNGNMSDPAGTHMVILAAAGLAIASLIVYAARTKRQSLLKSNDAPELHDDPIIETEEERREREAERDLECRKYDGEKFIFNPALYGSPLVVARTGERLRNWPPVRELEDSQLSLLGDLNWRLRDALDEDDPSRTRFKSSKAHETFAESARSAFENIRQSLGPDRLVYDPEIRPQRVEDEQTGQFSSIAIQARLHSGCLFADGDLTRNLHPEYINISLRLSDDLMNWGHEFDSWCYRDCDNNEDFYGPPHWDEAQRDDFIQRGKALAQRLRQEMAMTGRSAVRVDFVEAIDYEAR